MRIRGYTLIDIQSWDDKSGIVELDYDSMNCIIAPSETGKSVVIKILKEMCFPGNWGYTRRSLIRRGATCGQAVFFMEDDTAVIFKLWVGMVSYTLYDKNADNPMRVWEVKNPTGSEIPYEIANHMGLIVDREGKTVINVLDKDMVTPFVNAPNELNQRVLSVVTEVPELEARRKVLDEWRGQLEEVEKVLKGKLHSVEKAYNDAPSIDVLRYKFTKQRAESLLDFIKVLDLLLYDVNPDKFPDKPEEVYCPDLDSLIGFIDSFEIMLPHYEELLLLNEPNRVFFNTNLDNLMDYLKAVDELSLFYNELLTTVRPHKVTFNKSVDLIIDLMNDVVDIGKTIKEFCVLINKCVKPIDEPNDVVILIDSYCRGVWVLISTLNSLYNLKKPKEPFDNTRVSKCVDLITMIERLDLNSFEKALNDLNDNNSLVKTTEKELEALRKELGVCPTCGKPW